MRNICGDLKVVAILLGMQQGYTKYCCFLCEWDSRDRTSHYARKECPLRKNLTPGHKNFFDPKEVILPPLHIKLGLRKNFVKAFNKSGNAFRYLQELFSRISDAKLQEGIFVGLQIKEVMKDANFEEQLDEVEKVA